MLSPTKLLTFSNRVYCLLLYLYPASFRREFGYEMAQVFRDDTQQTLHEDGVTGFLNLWLKIVVDLNRTALTEHFWETIQRPPYKYVRWSGVAATIGGIIWLMPWFLPWAGSDISETNQLLMSLLGLLLVAFGLAGLHLHLKATGSRVSIAAFGFALVGLVLVIGPVVFGLVSGPNGRLFPIVLLGTMILVLGLILMGVITLSRQALGMFSFVPLVLAFGYITLLILIMLGESYASIKFLIPIFISLNMFCWLLLGMALSYKSQQMKKTSENAKVC